MIVVDLLTKSMLQNSVYLIKNGKPVNGYVIPDTNVTFDLLDDLYASYKSSVPDGIRYKYNYFKTADKNMDLKTLTTGTNRKSAKEKLESTLLIGVLNKSLIWPNPNHWFWQSTNDKDFVILKEWVMLPDS